jgi:hypothetical protein
MRPIRCARSSITPRRVLARGLLLVVLSVAGCGGGTSSSEFSAAYDRVTADHRSALEQAQAAARAAGPGQSPVAVYEQLRDATRTALDGYAELDAPDDAAAEFTALTRDLRTQVEALDRVLQATEKQDAGSARTALAEYAAALGAWQTTRVRLEAAIESGPARAGP